MSKSMLAVLTVAATALALTSACDSERNTPASSV